MVQNRCKFTLFDQPIPPDKKNDAAAYRAAMNEAEKRRLLRAELGKSFTFETVLSKEEKLTFLKIAKDESCFIIVIYVLTSDPQINIDRIKQRIKKGGHDVPVEKTVSRYERAMRLMPEALELADEGLIGAYLR